MENSPSLPKTPKTLAWTFPLPRTHTGMLLGNGVQGLMVWGVDTLNITVGRSGFWDHRGGARLLENTDYQTLRKALESGDEAQVTALYGKLTEKSEGPDRPVQLGCGRLELRFSDGLKPVRGSLDLRRAIATVELRNAAGVARTVSIHQSMENEYAWLDIGEDAAETLLITPVPTWEHIGGELAEWGYEPPDRWHGDDGSGGFCQATPKDGALALAYRFDDRRIVLATALEDDASRAKDEAIARVDGANTETERRNADEFWGAYWRDIPDLRLPDERLAEVWAYGIYKQAGMTTPGGVAATLQGPWLEEYQLPPWSSDYHFNINIEMIYWPTLGSNRLSHLEPLWDMILDWMPKLKRNAKDFFGVDDALMLPHAVDDECNVEGQFWTGTIDHACTAWMAQLAWLHYRYSMDSQVLKKFAWPMLTGAFNGYWAMLEEREVDGKRILSLPVSVSPEYGGASMNAWGRDASFQLAALHFLADTLPLAAAEVGASEDPRWKEARERVRPYSTIDGDTGFPGRTLERIALWEDQDLAESHRHHSHLGAIYPFCTIDPADKEHARIIAGSVYQWIRKGMGAWTGWCIPWASIICSRLGFSDAAVALLHWWEDVYTNEGRGTLHNSAFNGVAVFDNGYFADVFFGRSTPRPEVMQMDAGMGAVTAVMELLVQNRAGVIAVLPSIPARWKTFSFDGIRTEGAFLVGGDVEVGRLVRVRVKSLVGGTVRIGHRDNTVWSLDGRRLDGAVAEIEMAKGEEITLEAETAEP